ncbi:leukotriene A-4 hydrolase-like [Ptychodera flava]|uniref:leukotriene A-4 hydrolase-like n=1 Tax=Ptychodera flava TaxID=63121 RepID=UPI003969DF73
MAAKSAEHRTRDPNTLSNVQEVTTTNISLQLDVDFGKRTLSGTAKLDLKILQDGIKNVILDTRELTIHGVRSEDGNALEYTVRNVAASPFGSPLDIQFANPLDKDATTSVYIHYETSPKASALQWLTPEQTAGKKYPYLFSQCQAIHCRSMVPCQDAPAVKSTYQAKITVPRELVALMSALRVGEEPVTSDKTRWTYKFHQKVPIPSYLIAIVVGALESKVIGPRSRVWSEKEMVERAAYEFQDTEQFLATAEELCGPYVWGEYDLLILPPSFPYGGMENPCLTFVTPTTVAGDRSLVNVAAHEIAHSWTGNLVTNKTWEHFWLNEGHTVFVERKIIGRLHGEKTRHFECMGGWNFLRDTIAAFGDTNPHTHLVPVLDGVDPDDAFSAVPYEKGSALLFYLETLVGGPEVFEPFLRSYVDNFKYECLTTAEWKDYLFTFFDDKVKEGVFDEVDWNAWFNTPGMPPLKPEYDTTMSDACIALSRRWREASIDELDQFTADDLNDFTTGQKIEFLAQFLLEEALSLDQLKAMEKCYGFNSSKNSEIRFRWYRMCIRGGWQDVIPMALEFVTEQGRMKFVRPIYRDLYALDSARERAVETFKKNRGQMNNICSNMVAKDLKVDK